MTAARYRFDRCELHPAERRLLVDGRAAVLGGRAFDVLMALAERRGRVVAKDELLDAVWPGLVVEENNLAVQISILRKLLGTKVIATVAGRGYQFTAELQPLDEAPPPAPAGGGSAPATTTRLIGRESELAALAELLQRERLVTLVGPGGIGKTRLALGWCEESAAPAQRVVWVELAGLSDVSLLPATVLAGIGGAAAGAPLAALQAAIAPLALTLVLDNAEPAAAEVAALAKALLDAAPRLTLLVTSQVPLRLPAEHVLRLGTLSLPEGRVTPEQAIGHGAVALFVERARAADPLFELSPGNVTSVVEICQRLDGLPLALELAAARVASLGVTALASALDERLRLLGDAQRNAPARQRTLRAALEWSHALLDLRAQRVFRRLGVFAGGFTLGAAQAVVSDDEPAQALDPWTVMATVGRLVEDSLVTRDGADPPRYGLLESARLFALEQLERCGEAAAVRARHLAWCAGFVERVLGAGTLDAEGSARIAVEYPNLRAALEQSLGRAGGDRTGGAALAVGLVPYWRRLDEDDERRRWLEPAPAAAAAAPPPGDAADATVTRLLERLQADGLAVGARGTGMDAQTVIALARRLRAEDVQNFDGALKEIERAVDIASRVLAGGLEGEPATDAFVGDVLAGVVEQTRRGEFDHAADALDDALAELDRRETRRRAALQRSRRALLEAGVQQDLLRRDAFAVARRIEAIAALEAPARPTQSALYLEREAAALEEGHAQGVGLSIAVAVELMRRRLAAAADSAELRDAQGSLARALMLQGERETRPGAFEEAVHLCREAIAGLGGDVAATLDGAALNHLLAGALHRLGERERSPARLEEAVRCCDEALKLRTRDRQPQLWAESQARLGAVLRALGARESGTERLVASVAASREALKERTRSRSALEWGRLHNQIGIALSVMARRENSLARHHEAAAALRNALLEVTRERAPLDWAALQNNLGIELAAIGQHDGGLETLQAAVDAYREALREWSRERNASGWAVAQHNLGGALRLLGEREAGTQSLREAVLAFRESLREHTREHVPLHWAAAKNDIALALLALGRRETGTEPFEQAVTSLQEALLERRRETLPLDWATTQCDLAQALFALGERSGRAEAVAEAATAAVAALEVLTSDGAPEAHREARAVLASARRWLGANETAPWRRSGGG